MKVLWFTWKDITNPMAGGAEVVNDELSSRLVKDGHEVILIVGGYEGCKKHEVINGYKVIRVGNRYSVYFEAFKYYQKHLSNWADTVIEEVNTIPFMTQLYAKEKKMLFIHQLCREIWFYQWFFPLSVLGFILEPLYLWILRKNIVITVSESSKQDLIKYGFSSKHIQIIPEGVHLTPIKDLTSLSKYSQFTVLSFGAMRSMKKTIDQIKAFEIAKKSIPELQMKIAGDSSGKYGEEVLEYVGNSPFKKDIEYFSKVDTRKKAELMSSSHVLLVTSVKEGWGLVVSEAASQGTPAIVYNVDGLRDSVRKGEAGILCKRNTPAEMALQIKNLYNNPNIYSNLQEKGYEFSKTLTFDNSYKSFIKLLHE